MQQSNRSAKAPRLQTRILSVAIALQLCSAASALTPTDRFFAAPPGSPSSFTGYQWPLQAGWMNFTEAWDYTTGTARIAINDGGSMTVGNETAPSWYGSWDFGSRMEWVCEDPIHNGCGFADPTGATVPPWHVFVKTVVPQFYYFGQGNGVDLTLQTTAIVSGSVYNKVTDAWQPGQTFEFSDGPSVNAVNRGEAIHGTHVFSAIKAAHGNAVSGNIGGIAGACPDCEVLVTRNNTPNINNPGPVTDLVVNQRPFALQWMISHGAQVVSISYGDVNAAAPCAASYTNGESALCEVLRLARDRDVPFFAAAGNHLGAVDYPARDSMAIAVGGTDIQKRLWDEHLYGTQGGDFTGGCPAEYNPGNPYGTLECGSATGPELDFVAPAREILGLVPPNHNYAGSYPICGDSNFSVGNDGVGFCTGTSMATPLVAAAAGLIRSVNPLLPRTAVYEVLKQTADGNQVFSNRGWGMPNAGAAVKRTLGVSGGQQMQNRLTPLFVMKATGDRLYTVAPQVAVASFLGQFAERPFKATNAPQFAFGAQGTQQPTVAFYIQSTATEASAVLSANSYAFPLGGSARAAFYVFSGKASMFGVKMKPLQRLLSVASCDSRETTFDFTRNCPNGDPRDFYPDGIEGYLLRACPTEFAGCSNFADPSIPQAVYLRYSSTHKSFALLLASQLGESQFSTYQPANSSSAAAAPLGYAFKNTDTDGDGLIDGAERVIGTNRLMSDTDCDGQSDGAEYPTLQLQTVLQDPLAGPCL